MAFELPRITLVTPSLNQGEFLEETLDSALSQGYPNLEYMVIDGGSTDASVEIIKRYSQYLSYWISEPDRGQSDALIKGFARATGEIMNWINADDLLRPGALALVALTWDTLHSDLIIGEDQQFNVCVDQPVGRFRPAGYAHPECLRFWNGRFHYHQPPTFFSRRAYLAAGGLRADLHYVMDYDLYCRILALPDVQVSYLDQVLSAFRLHPAAKTARAKSRFLTELRSVSRPRWPVEWNAAGEQLAMDRHSAECSLFQAAQSLRSRDLRASGSALLAALRFAPLHAAGFALKRGWERRLG